MFYAPPHDYTWIRQTLTSVIADLAELGDRHLSADDADSSLWRIKQVRRELLAWEADRKS